jgi:FtsH-binding integral membrane protein
MDKRAATFKTIKTKGALATMAELRNPVACEENKMGRIGNRPYWILNFSILVRAGHQVGAAVFLAAFLLDEIVHPPSFYLVMVFSTGVVLFLAEWMRHRQICRELSGVATFVKLLLLGAAYHGFLSAPVAVLLAFVIASVAAHAPKMIRHRLIF